MCQTEINILTGSDISKLAEHLCLCKRSLFLVYDRNVATYAGQLCNLLESDASDRSSQCSNSSALYAHNGCQSKNPHTVRTMAIDACESNKTIETVIGICRWLLANNADRKSLLLAMGGGVTTDMAGFAACIYKRGIAYANIPTTLLSQVDAGIGGKTGVNLDSYKNMIGAIVQPEFTYICPTVLATLPRREFHSGAAEMLKTFIIGSAVDYEAAVALLSSIEQTSDITPVQMQQLEELVGKAAQIKANIVSQDPYEKGLRRVLNLGHTWGHAIEWYQNRQLEHTSSPATPADNSAHLGTSGKLFMDKQCHYTHGEAVAMGIIKIAGISEQMGVARSGLKEKLTKDFTACGLPTQMPYPEKELLEAVNKDKKTENGKVHLILIKESGSVVIQ